MIPKLIKGLTIWNISFDSNGITVSSKHIDVSDCLNGSILFLVHHYYGILLPITLVYVSTYNSWCMRAYLSVTDGYLSNLFLCVGQLQNDMNPKTYYKTGIWFRE